MVTKRETSLKEVKVPTVGWFALAICLRGDYLASLSILSKYGNFHDLLQPKTFVVLRLLRENHNFVLCPCSCRKLLLMTSNTYQEIIVSHGLANLLQQICSRQFSKTQDKKFTSQKKENTNQCSSDVCSTSKVSTGQKKKKTKEWAKRR